ncbi:MAG: DEAD/DEAH box helicase [Bacteroidia bacterium]|nr:DEAD/DEAH box helicase [Bacteroidia bacterium]
MTFEKLGLYDELLEGLEACGWSNPTPIQEQAIPAVLEGKDLIGCAQTGTGKTGAFLLPIIHKICDSPVDNKVKCLILSPTRELAKQIADQAEGFEYFTNVTSKAVYGGNKGGEDFSSQKNAIQNGTDIIIGTPGRVISFLNLGVGDFSGLKYFILDEADKMLEMGFQEDILRILSYLPAQRQNILFSATMPAKIRSFAKNILHDPVEITLSVSKPAEGIQQGVYLVYDRQKIDLLKHVFKQKDIRSVLIFASRKTTVNEIVKTLQKMNINAIGMHSDKDQNEREEIMNKFKHNQINILVATDILSRGIDVDNISHVINYDVPADPEDYIHRIGRTARYEATGEAYTFLNDQEQGSWSRIEQMIGREIEKLPLPEGFGPGPEYNPRKRGGNRGGAPFKRGGGPRNSSKSGGRQGGGNSQGSKGRNQGKSRNGRRDSGKSNQPKSPS